MNRPQQDSSQQSVDLAPGSNIRIARRLQIGLGLLWLLDGALQLQPFMFGPGFAKDVISPAADGQPHIVSAGVHWSAALILTHPAFYDSLFAIVQLGLGFGLLFRPTAHLALAASIGWALGIWYFGEGLGGLTSGRAWMLTGAPGAALLYAILAAALWPRVIDSGNTGRRLATIASWFPGAWATVWIGVAVMNALPGQNSAAATTDAIDAGAVGAPGWLADIDHHLGIAIRHGGTGLLIAVIAVQAIIGISALYNGAPRRIAAIAGAALSLVYWTTGQSLGQLYSGQATDPNSGVLMVLFAAALFATAATRSTPKTHTAESTARFAGQAALP